MADVPFDALEAAERGYIEAPDDMGEQVARPTRRRDRGKDVRRSALEKFAKLRQEGVSKYDLINEEFDDVYDEVDEATYNAMRRQRLADEDFIEHDEGEDDGYRDHGGEIWDDEDFAGQSAAAKQAKAQQRRGQGRNVRKQPSKKQQGKRRANLFGSSARKMGSLAVSKDEVAGDAGDDDLLAQLLGQGDQGLDMVDDAINTLLPSRKRKKGLMHVALHGSTQQTRDACILQDKLTSPTLHASMAGSPARKRRPTGPPAYPSAESPEQEDRDYCAPSPDLPGGDQGTHDEKNEATVDGGGRQPETLPFNASPSAKRSKRVNVVAIAEEDDDDDEEEEAGRSSHVKVSQPSLKVDSDWEKLRKQGVEELPDIQVEAGKLPLVECANGQKALQMYWLDAYEPENNKSGNIFLFGKVWMKQAKAFVSCCLTVEEVERNLFFLPRKYKVDAHGNQTDEPVGMEDVYKEVSTLLNRSGVQKFCCKPVVRKYAFEKAGVPAEETYLKVKYAARFPTLSPDLAGTSFSHVFGTTITALERFLMKRDLMGPCWLTIEGAVPSPQCISWCKLEATVDNAKKVLKTEVQPPAPTLTVLSLTIQTMLNQKTHQNEILLISGLVHDAVEVDGATADPGKRFKHFTSVRQLGDNPFPFDLHTRIAQAGCSKTLNVCQNERSLLAFVLAKISKIDPDIIVGHNVLDFDLDVLLHRLKANSVPHWSRIGRLRRTQYPKLQGIMGGRASFQERAVTSGRLLCDVKVSAREFIRMVNYELNELAATQLQVKRDEIDPEHLPQYYNTSEGLLALIAHVERDAYLIISLMFKLLMLPLSKQITNITGGLLARTFAGGRAERNEYLLCHEFHRRKYIVPDKFYGKQKEKNMQPVGGPTGAARADGEGEGHDADEEDADAAGGAGPSSAKGKRKKPQYSGGLVLEPKRGFYDKFILLLDFNSLYPSIIQEYNLCFTTVSRDNLMGEDGETRMAEVPEPGLETGVLPSVLRALIQKRHEVKKLMKKEVDPARLTDYDIRQKALKLTANSMYGCLGYGGSRFYAKPIAALITAKGREILQKTVDLAQGQENLDVIYGDTDSIMINTRTTDLKDVYQIGNRLKKEVNKLYRELEIEIDGVFKTMLLLKKKKYAALAIVEKNGVVTLERETKGLDMVRRDWCGLSHDVGFYILNQVLSRESREDLVEACHEYLTMIAQDMHTDGKVPLEKYVIHKGLTKNPEDYPDKKTQPHVQVALRMKATGKSVRALDTIPYVVCDDGTTNAAGQRAYHPDDLRKNIQLKVDVEYYLRNQVHPVVTRLMDPIEGTDAAQIAHCLGLDPSAFAKELQQYDPLGQEIGMGLKSQMSDEDKYQAATKLQVTCHGCNHTHDFAGVLDSSKGAIRCGLLCPEPSCSQQYSAHYLCNVATMAIRQAIHTYYEGIMICDDPSCKRQTRQLSVRGTVCLDQYCRGRMYPVYTDALLATQISYLQYLFDTKHALEMLSEERRFEAESVLTGHMETFKTVFKHTTGYLEKSARRYVTLESLF